MTEEISRALVFAAQAHSGQHRKDGRTPYINHPIEVMHLLMVHVPRCDDHLLMAALLHDVAEDTHVTIAELAEEFGDEVARLVSEMTDDKMLSKEERKRLQLRDAKLLSPRARLLRICDKICNVYDIIYAPPGDWDLNRRIDYLNWAKSVVDQIRGTHLPLEERFDELYREGIKHLS